ESRGEVEKESRGEVEEESRSEVEKESCALLFGRRDSQRQSNYSNQCSVEVRRTSSKSFSFLTRKDFDMGKR
ncbi:hypothetical protein, partial [Clostridium sp. YIM B02506]|uniref:hypothetical protein n=1 Tax=Clostridium sp. YIM B02506 TaxID=2910680 RepID=UPI001EEEF72B